MAKSTKQSRAGQASSALVQKPSSAGPKTAAAGALSQAQNPRTGRFVKIDRRTGTIVGHKGSDGAYPGVPIAGGATREN